MSLPVVVDLETLGTKPYSAILSIGAVEFDPIEGTLGREFYVVIDKESSLYFGLEVDKSTEEWWAKQSPEARTVLSEKGVDLRTALTSFSEYFTNRDETLWGNGSDFDNVLLSSAYDKVGVAPPWKYYNNRCYRTLKNMFPSIKMKREGTYHNALDDAKSQAKHLIAILQEMRK